MPYQLPQSSLFTFRSLSAVLFGLGACLGSQAQTVNSANAAALLNQANAAGLNVGTQDVMQSLSSGSLPASLTTRLQGLSTGGAGLPSLTSTPDNGAQDAQRGPVQAAALQPLKPEAPSQFQRFVQETTGKLLPVFGASLFDNPQNYAGDSAVAAPGEYLIGPGDEVRVQIWGAVDFTGTQTVDRNGLVTLPKIGTVNLSGVQVKDLEATLRKQVATVYTNVNVSASLGKLRGITVYVVGQARRPGTYNLTSLSTLVNAVFASGGPGVNGSMRRIELKRGGKTITTLDLYDFIAQGDKSKDAPLQPGDIITIPPVGPRMALTGATDHSAIYELKPGTSVQEVLSIGGGVPTLASAQKAQLERIDTAQAGTPRRVQDLTLDPQGLAQPLRDGDVLTLLPMSPAFGNAVTLQGAVAQPLRHAWFAGMRVSDLIPSREALISRDFYTRRNQLVQNRIASLRAQGYTAEQIQALQRTESLPEDISLTSELISRNPYFGQVNQGTPLQQGQSSLAIANIGGNKSAGQIAPDQSTTVQSANSPYMTEQELQAQREQRLKLARNPVERVRGFAEQINWEYAVIQRLNKAELKTELIPFNLAKAVIDKDPAHNLELQPDDVITVMSSADLRLPVQRQNRLVRVEGEVAAPGVYQALPGETLPQLLKRIGGLTLQAYVYGTEFTRETVRKQQQDNLDQLIRRLETQMQSAGATVVANLTGDRLSQAQALQRQQQDQMKAQIDRLRAMRSKGRVALELNPGAIAQAQAQAKALDVLPNVPLEDGDSILVPSTPAFVSAVGSVNNENVFIYTPGKTVGDIINAAGLAEDADIKQAFVARADGSLISRSASGWFSSFEGTKVMPGDTVVVPALVDRESKYNFIVRGLRDWTQIFSNLGIGAAAIRTLRN